MTGMFVAVAGVPARYRQCTHAKEQDQNTRGRHERKADHGRM